MLFEISVFNNFTFYVEVAFDLLMFDDFSIMTKKNRRSIIGPKNPCEMLTNFQAVIFHALAKPQMVRPPCSMPFFILSFQNHVESVE